MEILLLRHQLTVHRQLHARPKTNWADRELIALLLNVIPRPRRALRIFVTPQTVLHWHLDIVRRRWARRSQHKRPGRQTLVSDQGDGATFGMPSDRPDDLANSPTGAPRRAISASQRAVEDKAVTAIIVDDSATFVGIVIRSLHNRSAVFLDSLRSSVDISSLDTDHDLSGQRMIHCGRQRERDRSTVEGSEVTAVAKPQWHPQSFTVKPDGFIQIVGRQDNHSDIELAQRRLLQRS